MKVTDILVLMQNAIVTNALKKETKDMEKSQELRGGVVVEILNSSTVKEALPSSANKLFAFVILSIGFVL